MDTAFTFQEGTAPCRRSSPGTATLGIACEDQAEVDRFWFGLIEGGGSESECGWLKDKYGLSWQVTPTVLHQLIADPDPARAGCAVDAILSMKRLVIADVIAAADALDWAALRSRPRTLRRVPEAEIPLEPAELAFDLLLRGTALSAQHELPRRVAEAAVLLGARDALIHLADLQQTTLAPFLAEGAGVGVTAEKLRIDGTIAGRAFQNIEVLTQTTGGGPLRVWLPLTNGTERLGVLAATVDDHRLGELNGLFGIRLRRFAALVAQLLTTKTMFGDSIVRLRRNSEMGLAAELQWSLLPPLTFASREVTIAGALEPAYEVAGDTLDYAVDSGIAAAAVFDGMGHGLRSAQLAAISVAAYRNARRARLSLADGATAIHTALVESFGGAVYTTGVICELDTVTGIFSWVNAGHPHPLLLRDGRLVKTLSCRPAPPMGLAFPVGHDRPPYVVCREQLEPDDHVLLFTDGVTEARSPEGEFFGDARLADLLTRNYAADLPAPETLRRVVRALLEHQQGQLNDDATLLLVQWRNDPQSLTF